MCGPEAEKNIDPVNVDPGSPCAELLVACI
jgi:hypothetical protein